MFQEHVEVQVVEEEIEEQLQVAPGEVEDDICQREQDHVSQDTFPETDEQEELIQLQIREDELTSYTFIYSTTKYKVYLYIYC